MRFLLQASNRVFHEWHSFSSFFIFFAIYKTKACTMQTSKPSWFRWESEVGASYFVHVLFEAAVHAAALRHRALDLIKLLGVHVELRTDNKLWFVRSTGRRRDVLPTPSCRPTWLLMSPSCSLRTFSWTLYSAVCLTSCRTATRFVKTIGTAESAFTHLLFVPYGFWNVVWSICSAQLLKLLFESCYFLLKLNVILQTMKRNSKSWSACVLLFICPWNKMLAGYNFSFSNFELFNIY